MTWCGMREIHIGTSSEFVRIEILSRELPDDDDYWDGNWLTANAEVRVDGFRVRLGCNLRAEEFVSFAESLVSLQKSLSGAASFDTMETTLDFEMRIDALGHIPVQGTLRDPGRGVTLNFAFELDQSLLPPIIAQVESVIREFPVKGSPND